MNQRLATCGCAETIINGRRLPFVPFHDCEYIHNRNLRIPTATKLAEKSSGDPKSEGFGRRFTQASSNHMDRLSAVLLK